MCIRDSPWAIRWRRSDAVELAELRHPVEPEDLDGLDWFLAHEQALYRDPQLLARAAARFEVAGVCYERASHGSLGPILVLRERTGEPGARTLFELFPEADPAAYQPRLQHPVSVDFRRRYPEGVRQLVLLGWEVEPGVAGGELVWLDLHWYAGPLAGHDFTVAASLTAGGAPWLALEREPTGGAHPTSTWEEGLVVRDSWLLPAPPADAGPGERLPARLWLGIPEYGPGGLAVGGLNPFRPSGVAPFPREPPGEHPSTSGGRVWSPERRLLVGGFWLAGGAGISRP